MDLDIGDKVLVENSVYFNHRAKGTNFHNTVFTVVGLTGRMVRLEYTTEVREATVPNSHVRRIK